MKNINTHYNKKTSGLSIKSKLLLLILSISLVPIASITVIHYFNARGALKRQALEKVTAIAESKKFHIFSLIEAIKARTAGFSSDGFIRDSLEKIVHNKDTKEDSVIGLKRHLLFNKKPLDRHVVAIAVLDINGKVVAASDERCFGQDMSGQEVFTRGLSETYFDKPRKISFLDTKCFLVSSPLSSKKTGELIGVIINVYDIDIISEVTADRTGMGETGEVVLGQKIGDDIVFLNALHYAPEAALEKSVSIDDPTVEPLRLALSGNNGVVEALDYRGTTVMAAYQFMPDIDWGLVVKMDKTEVFAPVRLMGIVAIIVGCICSVVAAGIGIPFAISTTRPIRDLKLAVERFVSGDMEYRVNTGRKDELGVLAGSFNHMAEKLSEEISGREQAQENLKQVVEELERSNKELEQLAYVASHDLQEPLRMVASYVQLLQRRYKDKIDDDANDFIAYAVDGAKRMQGLINDLLSYSRVGSRGKDFDPIDCETVLDRVVCNLEASIKGSGAVVTHDSIPTVMADRSQIVQLFQNLIGNAIKYCNEDIPSIHISAKENGKDIIFSVNDNGIGIDPQYYERIFTIFQRLHGKEEYSGTGIGLAICKKIVKRHGGRIWLESQPGKGATFYFTIPKKGVT